MAVTQNTYTGNGSTVLYSFTFPYLETTDVKVTVNGTITTAYTFANATTIQFNTAPLAGAAIRIYRQTDDSSLRATFYSGSAIRAQDLNDDFTQNLYVAQEVNNNALDIDGSNPMVGDLNMGGYKVTNLATPVAGTDAANRSFVEGVFSSEVPVFYRRWSKTAAGGETGLSGNDDNGIALSYVPGSEKVFINGALQVRGVDYSGTTGTTLTGIPALTAGDIVEVHSSSSYTVGTVPDGSITNAKVDGGAGIQSTKLAFIQSGSGATTRTVAAKLADVVSVKDFGAVGDGVADDKNAFTLASSASASVLVPPGTYRIGSNLAIPSALTIAGGGVIKPASGVTVTLGDGVTADRYQIFDLTLGGTIATNREESIGYPEWFGAVIDTIGNATANLTAIQNTLSIFGECSLAGGDYFISNTLEISASFKTIKGVSDGVGPNTSNGQTRLIVTSATADVVSVYTSGFPSNSDTWISNVRIENLQLARSLTPLTAVTIKNSGAGLRGRYVNWLRVRNVFAGDHTIGFFLTQTVRTYLTACHVVRVSNSGQATDTSVGFWLDGSSRISGFVSGNASCYLSDCSLTHNSGLNVLNDTLTTTSIGLYCEGTASDLFVNDFEVSRSKQGITFNMAGFTGDEQLKGMQDVHIRNFVLDNVSSHGVLLQNLTLYSHIVRLNGGYIQLTANNNGVDPVGILELDSSGQVTLTDTQIIGRCTNSTGIKASSAQNSYYHHSTIIDCSKPFVQIGGRHITFVSSILNGSGYTVSSSAVSVSNGSRSYYYPTIDGSSNVFTKAIEFTGSPQNLLQVNTTNTISTAVSGGSSNILVWKGASVTGHNNGVIVEGSDRLLHEGFIA